MHRTRVVIGIIAVLLGLVWVGQGIGLLPGSFMSGDLTWAVVGIVIALFGLALILVSVRARA